VIAIGDGRDGAPAGTVLPLLEFALTQVWVRRDGPYLTHAAYAAIGGVIGGLTQWADEAVHDLTRGPRDRAPLVRRILVDLVQVGNEATGVPDSRASRTLTELVAGEDGQTSAR